MINYKYKNELKFTISRNKESIRLQIAKGYNSNSLFHITFTLEDGIASDCRVSILPTTCIAAKHKMRGTFEPSELIDHYIVTIKDAWYSSYHIVPAEVIKVLDVYTTLILDYILKNGKIHEERGKVFEETPQD